jgi:hypothetical protein
VVFGDSETLVACLSGRMPVRETAMDTASAGPIGQQIPGPAGRLAVEVRPFVDGHTLAAADPAAGRSRRTRRNGCVAVPDWEDRWSVDLRKHDGAPGVHVYVCSYHKPAISSSQEMAIVIGLRGPCGKKWTFRPLVRPRSGRTPPEGGAVTASCHPVADVCEKNRDWALSGSRDRRSPRPTKTAGRPNRPTITLIAARLMVGALGPQSNSPPH